MNQTQKFDLAEVAISLFGIWFSVQFLGQAVIFLVGIRAFEKSGDLLLFVVPTVFYGIVGAVLLILRRRIASALFESSEPTLARDSPIDAQTREFLISLMGLWFICTGIVDGAETEKDSLFRRALEFEYFASDMGRPRSLLTPEAWSARMPYISQILVGIGLFASGGRVAELWSRLRKAGHSK